MQPSQLATGTSCWGQVKWPAGHSSRLGSLMFAAHS